ncbi:hypothetical protein BIW11_03974 [Tropilaelaps mercedesae]|uniref:Uncharacterized protein n=1 Tax=Tropilaelaps mercedesae TaxID=418985 RepID=A0A1V9XD88_9ACAR|nr:hypothetical protein BIW11_03974 [Tropilaelaps mercedesae]
MGQELLYEDEVLLALAAVSLLFEGAQSKDSDDGCSQARWVSLAPPEGFRLLNGVILYEQLVFELYTCDAFVKPDRRLKLENEATITRRRLVACLKQQPNIARPIVIHNEDRGAVRIPVQVTPILDTVQRLQRFHRFLRKSSGVELSFVVAVAKSVARIRSICGSRLPNQRVTSSSEDTSAEMHIEHNGVQARLHPHTNPVYQPVSVSVSSSTKLNFSRYNTLEAIAVGLAALAKGAFSSIDKGGVWQADALDDIIQAGKTLFNDTVLLTRQLAGQTGRDDLTESQLDEMLGQLDDQMELVQFNCRVISTSREVSQWRGLKRRQIVQLDESTFEQAITEFFLSSKTALVVAKGTVLALCDGDVRNAVEVAADHCLISHSHVSVSDVVGMVFRIFQGAAILHVFDESPRADLIPRPIDQIEVQAWSESEQCAYHDAIWSLLKDQGRLKRRKTAAGTATRAQYDTRGTTGRS